MAWATWPRNSLVKQCASWGSRATSLAVRGVQVGRTRRPSRAYSTRRVSATPPLPNTGQEPGENSEIINCVQYVRPGNGFKIPAMMTFTEKGDVNGLFATPLAKALKSACGGKDVGWNFEAWTVNKQGVPVTRYLTGFNGNVGPMGLVTEITALLAQ